MTTHGRRGRIEQSTGERTDSIRGEGLLFLTAAIAFFAGSAVLTRSGTPGASTRIPWLVSHAAWVVAAASVALGTRRLVRGVPGIAGDAAGGAFGLAVVHALQWTAWVYVDVYAYGRGNHELLSTPLFHPFGTAHMLVFAVLVGSGVVALAWTLVRAGVDHRLLPWLGFAVGTLAVAAGSGALLAVADVRTPASLAAILLIAASFAWLGLVGAALVRDRSIVGPGSSS